MTACLAPHRRLLLQGALLSPFLSLVLSREPVPPALAQESPAMQLAGLIIERLQVMEGVAMNKWNSGAAIEDQPREQLVVDAATRRAAASGMDLLVAARFIRAQIEAAKVVQASLFLAWTRENHPLFAAAPDLGATIRPALDRLTPALVDTLKLALADDASLLAKALAQRAGQLPSLLLPAYAVAIAPLVEKIRAKK